MPINLNKNKCLACGGCASSCPVNALELINGEIKIDKEKCIECGICEVLCPAGAIKKGDQDD